MIVVNASRLNEYDQLMLAGLADFLSRRNPELDTTRCEQIANTVFKSDGEFCG